LNYELLDQQRFNGVIEQNNKTLAKKENWTLPLISFSYIRNMLMYSQRKTPLKNSDTEAEPLL